MAPGKESAQDAPGKMFSILRIEASRANGAKSRGPVTVAGRLASLANSAKSTGAVTPEGHARSSQNAIRHGILVESAVLGSESAGAFSEVLSTLQEELQPSSSIESKYVETMALAEWRRLRLICLEKEQMTIEASRQEAADLSSEEMRIVKTRNEVNLTSDNYGFFSASPGTAARSTSSRSPLGNLLILQNRDREGAVLEGFSHLLIARQD
jgi:hypothetical protein